MSDLNKINVILVGVFHENNSEIILKFDVNIKDCTHLCVNPPPPPEKNKFKDIV